MKLSYNILTDFTHIALIADGPPVVLIVNASLPYKTVSELVAGAKAAPGKLSFGSSGSGTSSSIAISQLKSMAGIDIVDVPYRGGSQVVMGVVGNEIQASFPFLLNAKPLIEEGKLRLLATAGPARIPSMPDVPTMIESGFAGFQHEGFVGLAAPAGTPQDIVDLLNKQITAIVREESFVKRIAPNGLQPPPGRNSPADVFAFMSQQIAMHGELAKLSQK
jgi:tripartite-type tricarboxylate transporter receptor subunit TctC